MYEIEVKLEGIVPILFNRPFDITGSGGAKKTPETLKKEAIQRLHMNGKDICLPPLMLKNCLTTGAAKKGLKQHGRQGLAGFIGGGIFVQGDMLFGKKKPDFIHEHWGRIPPGPKGSAVTLYRPALNEGWKLSFGLSVLDDNISSDKLRQALEYGGLFVGLGAWRPEFGRFVVKKWGDKIS